jgi:hypothetical protein
VLGGSKKLDQRGSESFGYIARGFYRGGLSGIFDVTDVCAMHTSFRRQALLCQTRSLPP